VRRDQKEQVVAQLTESLRATDTLLVADYRGLTMSQIDTLRTRLRASGARFTVVKNTLTRRAAEAAGAEALLALLEGPSAIAFLEADGDMVAAAKALADAARETRVLEIRGGLTQGRVVSAEEVERLATLPPLETLRAQVIGAIVAPITALAGLVNAPLQSLHGLLEARIEQLGGAEAATAPAAEEEAQAAASPPPETVEVAEVPGGGDEESTPADATASASDDVSDESEEA
jgi:large subunit ribosomal protein L10